MFRLSFDTDNAAFSEDEGAPDLEIVRILDVIGTAIEGGARVGNIRDIDGNTIGTWRWTT